MADEPQFAPIQVYLTVKGADAASKFYQRAFGATENLRQLAGDKTRLMHCDISVFGGNLMFSDEFPEMGHADTQSPLTRGGASATVHVNLRTPDAVMGVMKAAADEGARITQPAEKTFWGAYYGRLIDPFGHSWSFAAPAEPPPEPKPASRKRAAAKIASAKKAAAKKAPTRRAAAKPASRKAAAKAKLPRKGKR